MRAVEEGARRGRRLVHHDDGRVPRLPRLRGGVPQRRALRPHDRGARAPRPSPPGPRPRARRQAASAWPGVLPRRHLVMAAGWMLARGARAAARPAGARRPSGPPRPPASLRELRQPIPRRAGRRAPVAKVLVGLRHGRGLPPRPAGDHAGWWPPPASGPMRTPAGRLLRRPRHALRPARGRAGAMARERIAELEDAEMIVVNASGCSAHVKAYGELLADDPVWAERAERVAERTRDLIELVLPPRDARPGHAWRCTTPATTCTPSASSRAPCCGAAGASCVERGRRRALLRGGRPLQRAPARAVRPAAAPEGRGDRGHRRARWWPWPTRAAPSRSPPACARSARASRSGTPPSWSPRAVRAVPSDCASRNVLCVDVQSAPPFLPIFRCPGQARLLARLLLDPAHDWRSLTGARRPGGARALERASRGGPARARRHRGHRADRQRPPGAGQSRLAFLSRASRPRPEGVRPGLRARGGSLARAEGRERLHLRLLGQLPPLPRHDAGASAGHRRPRGRGSRPRPDLSRVRGRPRRSSGWR